MEAGIWRSRQQRQKAVHQPRYRLLPCHTALSGSLRQGGGLLQRQAFGLPGQSNRYYQRDRSDPVRPRFARPQYRYPLRQQLPGQGGTQQEGPDATRTTTAGPRALPRDQSRGALSGYGFTLLSSSRSTRRSVLSRSAPLWRAICSRSASLIRVW